MHWRDRAEALRRRLGKNAQDNVLGLFTVLAPRRADLAYQIAGAPPLPDFPAADRRRLDELFDLLDGPLDEVHQRAATAATPGGFKRSVRALLKRPEVAAARDRLAELTAQGLHPFPPRRRGNQLHQLPLGEGLQLGCWRVWDCPHSVGVLMWHPPSGRLVRVWTGSNGWWEYRAAGMPAEEVYIVWSSGSATTKSEGYTRLDGAPEPRWTFPPGHYAAEDWRFTAGKCELLIRHQPSRRVITLGLARPLLSCNDADLPGT